MYESLGLKTDLLKNGGSSKTKREIHDEKSRIRTLVIPTDEELEIAFQTEKIIQNT